MLSDHAYVVIFWNLDNAPRTFFKRLAVMCAATSSSLGMVNDFFDSLDLEHTRPCEVPDS